MQTDSIIHVYVHNYKCRDLTVYLQPGTFVNIDDMVMTISMKINEALTPIFTDSKYTD